MADEKQMLQAIFDAPLDDAPRLAFADWCAIDDPQRSAFIRYQINLANAGEGNPDRVRLYTESEQLLKTHGQRWAGALGRAVPDYSFHRGFIEWVAIDSKDFVKHASRIFAAAPILHIDFSGQSDDLAPLLDIELLSLLISMSLDDWDLNDAALQKLARCHHLENLRWLSLANNALTLSGARALAQSNALPALRYVNFTSNRVDLEERFAVDQGVILDSWLSDDGVQLEQEFGHVAWLHSGAKMTSEYPPNRFTLL